MATHFEIRQFVKRVSGGTLEAVYTSTYERSARMTFSRLREDHPSDYFELVRVEHDEQCLEHNGTPQGT